MSAPSDRDCVAFMQWALPFLGMRWRGFRRVRRQVCRRIRARCTALGLGDYGSYRAHLGTHPEEWRVLDTLCRVTISRFYRDRTVFAALPSLLEALARGAPGRALRVWSAGCASGEEPYSVVLAAEEAHLEGPIEVVATDADAQMLARARRALYPAGSLRDLAPEVRAAAFVREGDAYRLLPRLRQRIELLEQDVRREAPPGIFDLILCRNLAFTYFDEPAQRGTCASFAAHARAGAALIVGAHEALPADVPFEPWPGRPGVYRCVGERDAPGA